MKPLHKLLFREVRRARLAGFFLASLFGMTIVLLGVQFYYDIRPLVSGGNSLLKGDYLVLTKKNESFSPLAGKNVFGDEEIAELSGQPFVRRVGIFRPSLFSVSAGLGLKSSGLYFSTEMFFESVPDEYIDAGLEKWHFDAENRTIPIIIPRNYLDLYNFGFAPARNLPRLTEEMLGLIGLEIVLEGNGTFERYTGTVVGFSDRLNTILVPEKFMEAANSRLAPGKDTKPSRLIVETDNPADGKFLEYLRKKGYEAQDNRSDRGKTAYFMRLVTGAVSGVGLVICLLSFYMLLLSIYLLLQKNRFRIRNLLLLGYAQRQVARPYQYLVLRMNGAVLVLALVLTVVLRTFYLKPLGMLVSGTVDPAAVFPSVCAGLLLFVVLSAFHVGIIRRKISDTATFPD